MKIRIASFTMVVALAALLTTQALAGSTVAASATQTQKTVFYLDLQPMNGVESQVINGSYYVTLRSIMPLMDENSHVEEDSGKAVVTGSVSCQGKTDTLSMTAVEGQIYVEANGRFLYVEDGVKTLNGAVAIPLRTLAKVLCKAVWYEDSTGWVYITSSDEPGYLTDGSVYYDYDSVYWMSRIIYHECGNQPLFSKIAVGNTVLNRVNSSLFPNTICEVLFQKNQFCSASELNRVTPNEDSVIAAKLALDGAVALEGVLFFSRAGLSCFASRNRPHIATIGVVAFYG